jgi:hypothetical protein
VKEEDLDMHDLNDQQLNSLNAAYDQGTFGVSRRAFVKLAAAAGVAAMGGALVFPESEAQADFTEPATSSWPELNDDSKVYFTMHSDTHVDAEDNNNWADKVPAAFKAIYEMCPNISAHFFIGDSVDTGAPTQYDHLAEILNNNAKAPIGIVMGNHEYYYWCARANNNGTIPGEGAGVTIYSLMSEVTDYSYVDDAQEAFSDFVTNKLAVEGSFQMAGGPNEGETDCDFVVGGDGTEGSGYHVLALSSHAGGNDHNYYGDRKEWVLEHLDAAAKEDPNKPIFMLTHHGFVNTVHVDGATAMAQFGDDIASTDTSPAETPFYDELCEKYPQLIHFSGHSHIPMADPRSIFQEGFTLVQTATFSNNFWMLEEDYDDEGETGGHPASGRDASQCELVEIDKATNVVTIYRLDFRNGAVIGEPWVVDPSAGAEGFAYTNAQMDAESAAPVVAADAQVSVTDGGASFSITADKVTADTDAMPNDIVLAYRIEVREGGADGGRVYDARYMSDYYKATVNQAATFERPLLGADLKSGVDYTMVAYAIDAFGKESKIGEASFTA